MADRIVLNTISYHGHGAIENIVPELTARGYKKAFVCSDPDLIKFGVTKKVTDLLDAANFAYACLLYTSLPIACIPACPRIPDASSSLPPRPAPTSLLPS